MKIKVISWNIWGGKNRDGVISFLKTQNADIIALQEVTTREKNGIEEHDAEKIAEELGYECYFANAFTTDRHFPTYSIGNAILSKFPIKSPQNLILSDLSDYKKNSTTEPRTAVRCVIEIEGTELHIFSTHLGYSETLLATPLQQKQLESLLPHIPESKSILLGDFNSISESEIIKQIELKLHHTDMQLDKISWTNYKSDPAETYRIDYIFTTSDLNSDVFALGESNASDHFPLIATLSI
jgi:endonuclease/exonuclease/phosphatase family metal-dependent hydrolase